MILSTLLVILRYIYIAIRAIFVAILAIVLMVFLHAAMYMALCSYDERYNGTDIDRDFSAGLNRNARNYTSDGKRITLGEMDEQSILDKVREINIHVIPSYYNVSGCYGVFPEDTRIATLTGTAATDFLSPVLAAQSYTEAKGECYQNREKITYHVLVRQKDSERVGYFSVRRCITANYNSTQILFGYPEGVSYGITDTGNNANSDEFFPFLTLGAERSVLFPGSY